MLALEIANLKKTYTGGQTALKGISLTVKKGDFFALLGPNGAGKSTLISILTSLTLKDSGTVKICDIDIDKNFAEARRRLGVVPQEFNFNIFEKVAQIVQNQAGYYGIPRRLARERTEMVLRQLELWEKRNVQGRMLSGGMKRRLMIARALVHQPEVLILDEPTAGVDIELRRQMWNFLQQLNCTGTTIILTTHYLEEAEQLCRNIAIINQGEIIANTDKKSLLSMLDTNTLVLELAKPLKKAPVIQNAQSVLSDSQTLELTFSSRIPVSKILYHLETQKISFTGIRNKTNRLEELFVRLTAKRAS